MNSRVFVIVGIIGILILVGIVLLSGEGTRQEGSPGSNESISSVEQQRELPKEEPSEHLVLSTDAGFSPQDLSIKAGDRVVFQNKSSRSIWPASDIHPSHTLYPGSAIQKCATQEVGEIFDACKPIPFGQEWPFRFDIKGEWGYHDHRNPDKGGTIVVE
ncbi:MAG: hypothetical protein AAB567_00360 [Patescibacteria group bacterium]